MIKLYIQYPKKILRDYQWDAVQSGVDKRSMFWAMHMRLGKTLTVLRWLEAKGIPMKILILAPKTVFYGWEKELKQEQLEYIDLNDIKIIERKELMKDRSKKVFLLNIESIPYFDPSDIEDNGFDAIIIDESTRIKSPRTKTTKFLLRVCDSVMYKACLSGLPRPKSWSDVWSQCAFLGDGYFMGRSNFWAWEKKYSQTFGYEKFYSPKSIAAIKKAFEEQAFILTRDQAGLGEKKIYQIRKDKLNKQERKLYDHVVNTWEIPSTRDSDSKELKHNVAVLSYLRQICSGTVEGLDPKKNWKYKLLQELLTDELEGESVVIFCAFRKEIDIIRGLCKKLKIKSGVIQGGVKSKERARIQSDFRKRNISVTILQFQCGKYGLDLGASDTTIYYSNSYDYEDRGQSEDRTVVVGKKNPLLYIDFISQDTIDEDVKDGIQEKRTDARYLMARVRPEGKVLAQFGSRNSRSGMVLVERKKDKKKRLRKLKGRLAAKK